MKLLRVTLCIEARDAFYYVLSLGEDEGTDYVVRSCLNPELKNSEYEVLGDSGSGVRVCLDFFIYGWGHRFFK